MHTVSVTAHRDLSELDIHKIHAVMHGVVEKAHVDVIYFGGARGGDTEALRAALHFRGDAKRPKLIVVVPDSLAQQPLETQIWSKKADAVVELNHPITKDDGFEAYTKRDQYLVDMATTVLAFFSGNYATGTGKTVRMAETKGTLVTKIVMGVVDS